MPESGVCVNTENCPTGYNPLDRECVEVASEKIYEVIFDGGFAPWEDNVNGFPVTGNALPAYMRGIFFKTSPDPDAATITYESFALPPIFTMKSGLNPNYSQTST